MKKRFTQLLLGLILLNIFNIDAQQVTSNQALDAARIFLGNKSSVKQVKGVNAVSASPMKLAYIGGDFAQPDFYIYNVGEDEGFIIVSADERAHSILGYATEGSFNLATADVAFMNALSNYSEQTQALRSTKVETETPLLARETSGIQTLADITKIALLDTVSMTVTGTDGSQVTLKGIKYDQQGPYNNYCPMTSTGRALTGCGATAMSQIMRYNRWPDVGTGSHKNVSFANDSTIDFSKARYRWDLMFPTYYGKAGSITYGKEENRNAVAVIMHHAGVATNMIYASDGSGTGTRSVANAFIKYFKYNTKLEMAYRDVYSNDEWYQLIRNEIESGRIVVYSGYRVGGAHMFLCDGYDSEGRLHYNYGWSGTGNAYLFPVVDPNGSGQVNRYNMVNDAIIGISPNQISVRPQIAQLSVLNASNYSPNVGTLFNMSFRVSNYGMNVYNNGVRVALCDPETGDIVQYLLNSKGAVQETKITVPVNNIDMGAHAIRYQNVQIANIKIPSSVKDGTYDLKCFASVDGTVYPMLAKDGDVQKKIKVVKKGTATTFSYGLGASQRELKGVAGSNMYVAYGIGKAKAKIVNPHSRYAYNGNIFLIGYKSATATMELFATKKVNLAHNDTLDVEFSGMRMNAGDYTYYVAYNPINNAEGTWLGAVPIVESKMTFTVPEEKSFYDKNLNSLTDLPATYRQFNNDEEFVLPDNPTTAQRQQAPWVYNVMGRKAWSVLRLGFNPTITSHTLVMEPIEINDANAVLEWSVNLMGNSFDNSPHMMYVYVSDKGSDIANFTEETCLSRDTMLMQSGDYVRRESLYKYAGKKIYVAFKHLRVSSEDTGIDIRHIKILSIDAPKDIELDKIDLNERGVVGDSLPITITVRNMASLPITKFTAVYTVGDAHYEEELIHKGMDYDIPALFTLTKAKVNGMAGDKLDVKVTLVMEGESGDMLENNTKSAVVSVLKYHPRKTMMVYKVSRGGCGTCSYSYTHLDWFEEDYPSCFAGIELWEPYSNQPTYPEYGCSDFKDFYSSSTPSITLNNKGVWFQNLAQIEPFTVDQYKASKPVSEIKVQADYIDEQSRKMHVKLTSDFAFPMEGTYKMGIFVIESNVLANNFQIGPSSLVKDGHTKNHMPIAAPQGAKGQNSSYTIVNPKIGEDYTYEFIYEVPKTHGDETGNRTVNRDNIQVIGVMFNPNGTIDCTSLSSYYVRISDRNGLTFVSEDEHNSFKSVLEVKETARGTSRYVSSRQNRSTVLAGNDFRFHIAKSDSLGNRKVRLTVRESRESEAEQLVPDANGVYTLKNVDRYYFIDAEVLKMDEPTFTREGTGLVLKGSWDGVDFQRIEPLDKSITYIDMSAITVPMDAPQLVPANPNCLIYVATGAVVPAAWKNVVIGEEAETINLMDGTAFYNIKSFTASTVTYTRDYPQMGWSSLYLPFAVTEFPDGINLKKYTACTADEVRFGTFNEASTKANTPYMAEIISSGEKNFTAHRVKVETSSVNGDIKHDNGDFAFKGTFIPFIQGEAAGLFILNPDGTGFLRGGDKTTIPAFRAYLKNEGTDNTILRVQVNHAEPTDLESGQLQGDFRIYVINGKLVVMADQAMQVGLFSVDGQIVRKMDLNIGENIIDGLMPGFYLVGNKKVCIK